MNVSEFDLMSLDGSESDDSFDELLKDARGDEKGDSISSQLSFPDKPSLPVVLKDARGDEKGDSISSQLSFPDKPSLPVVLNDAGPTCLPFVEHLPLAQQKQPHTFASSSIPKDVLIPNSISIPKNSSLDNDSVEETVKHIPHTATGERIMFIQDSAHRT